MTMTKNSWPGSLAITGGAMSATPATTPATDTDADHGQSAHPLAGTVESSSQTAFVELAEQRRTTRGPTWLFLVIPVAAPGGTR